MRTALKIAVLAAFGASLWGQPYAVSPIISSQLFNTTGQPLSGGFIYTCVAGSTCPGTPQATYTDSTGSTPLPLPAITIGQSGYAQCGSPGTVCAPFLNTTLFYKFVIQDSMGATLYTFDGVSASGGGSSPAVNYWALSGSTISNTNGAGAGNVQVGANFTVAGALIVQGAGGLQLTSPASGGKFAGLVASNLMGASVTWKLPSVDAAGCLESDGAGNLSIAAGCGGGGTGTPGGSLYSIQSNNPSGSFFGDGNFVYTPTTTPPQVSLGGILQINGSTGGINVLNSTAYNGIQISQGGVLATQFTWAQEGAVPTVGTGYAAMVLAPDPTTTTYNVKLGDVAAGAFWPVAMTDHWAAFTTGDCLQVVIASGIPHVADAGGACTTGGGGGTVNAAAQFSVPYYSASGTATVLNGALNLSFTPSTNTLQLIGSTGGINVAAATAVNALQVPNGGATAKWLVATDSLFFTQEAVPALAGSGQARIYVDNTLTPATGGGAGLRISSNTYTGSNYVNIATTTGTLTSGHCAAINNFGNFVDAGSACGGGGGGPIGSDQQIPYNKAGVESADANLLWNYTTRQLTISGTGGISALNVLTGYTTSDGGFVTSSSSATAIQAPNGQITSKTMYVTDSYLFLQESPPALSGGGQARLYADNSGTLKYSINGGAYQTLSTGGLTSLNGLTGAPSIACNLASSCSVSAGGSTITITAPQPLATTSTPTFGNITSTGVFNSSNSGITFQNASGSFQVNSAGVVSAAGSGTFTGGVSAPLTNNNAFQTTGGVNSCSGGGCAGNSAYSVAGSTVINSSGQFIGAAVLATGNVQAGTGAVFAVGGGFFGSSATVVIGACTLFFQGGIMYAHSGC